MEGAEVQTGGGVVESVTCSPHMGKLSGSGPWGKASPQSKSLSDLPRVTWASKVSQVSPQRWPDCLPTLNPSLYYF
jgi:hypothetical protein